MKIDQLDVQSSNEVDVESLSAGEDITGNCCCCCCCCGCVSCKVESAA